MNEVEVHGLDESAYQQMLVDCWRGLYVFLRVFSDDRRDAEDATALTFERALRTFRSGRFPVDHPMPWLLTVARRIAIDRARRRRIIRWIPLAPEHESAGHDSSFEDVEAVAWFDGLRAVLSKRQYEVVVLRYLNDLPDAEIAQLLGITAGGVRTLAFRAHEILRAHPEVLDQ